MYILLYRKLYKVYLVYSVYMKITTIKITDKTKERLLKLEIAGKGKSFDAIINDLISNYDISNKKYKKDYKEWKKSVDNYKTQSSEWSKEMEKHKKEMDDYEKDKAKWDRLWKWAKSQGFKP